MILASIHKVRLSLFITSILPMLIWVIDEHFISKSIQVWGWCILCGVFTACLPTRLLKPCLLFIIASLPLTLAWIGAVAVTGFGPSNAAFEAARTGPFEELSGAIQLAIGHNSFIFVGLLTIASSCISCYLIWRHRLEQSSTFDIIFFAALIPFIVINLDGLGYGIATKLAGPEVRLSIPWLHQMEMGKSIITKAIDEAGRVNGNNPDVRNAQRAEKLFTMQHGIAIFVVGDSSRADTFIQPQRGPWSTRLQQRLNDGLGVRLNDTCAGGSSTADAIPRLFTGVDIADIKGANNNPTILALAKAAGAKTAYISNHETWLLPESGHDLIQRTTGMGKPTYDEIAVEAFANFLNKNQIGPKAAILHLYGQHFSYEDRYPHQEFAPPPKNLSGDTLIEWHYSQAVEYGNKVLLALAESIDQASEPGFIIFTSDHAENLPSDKTGKRYHALPSSGKFDTTVPALVLWNKAFKNSGKQQLLNDLHQGSDLLSHQDLARAWLALAGMAGIVKRTETPHTWGAKNPGEHYRSVPCSELSP